MIAHLFNETVTVTRSAKVSDGQGRWTDQPQPPHQVRCRIRPADGRGESENLARQAGVRISHVLYAAADADLERGDVVKLGNLTADVRAIRRPSIRDHHLMADLEERQT